MVYLQKTALNYIRLKLTAQQMVDTRSRVGSCIKEDTRGVGEQGSSAVEE